MDHVDELSKLTDRQREVLRLFCDGLDYKTISAQLFIAVSTVKVHMGNIYLKLELQDQPSSKRRMVLTETYCPLLRQADLAPGPPDDVGEPEPVPEPVIRVVEEDEKALVPVERALPPAIVEPPRVTIIPPEPPPQRRNIWWLLGGMALGALLIVGIIFLSGGFRGGEDTPQGTTVPTAGLREVTREVTVEVVPTAEPLQATVTPSVQTTEKPLEVTREVEKIVVVTATPLPLPTGTPQPTVDTRLNVGETWTEGGVSLTLDDAVLTLEGGNWRGHLGISFVFENSLTQDLIFSISKDNFFYEDNLGNRGFSTGWGWSCYNHTWDVMVPPGSTLRTIDCFWGSSTISKAYLDRLIWFEVDITNQSISEVTVTVEQFSRIQKVSWRIPIPH